MTRPDDPVLLFLPDQTATEALARLVARALFAGDVVLLSGEIGAGKSCFARAVIHDLLGSEVEVPSPTYTLVQTYETGNVTIIHADLYRIAGPDEIEELGLRDQPQAICLIEWPERAGNLWAATALHLTLTEQGEGRHLKATGGARLLAAVSGFHG